MHRTLLNVKREDNVPVKVVGKWQPKSLPFVISIQDYEK